VPGVHTDPNNRKGCSRLTIQISQNYHYQYDIRDSVVGIVTGYGMDDLEVGVLVPVSSIIIPGVKREEREADHLLPTSAELKTMRIYTSTPPQFFVV
jgi:hypothetical protein